MKKCPQCGTILEETKKKCYMCGAELQKKSFVDFGDAFDEQVGATITSSQDNVFNNVKSSDTQSNRGNTSSNNSTNESVDIIVTKESFISKIIPKLC